MSLIPLMARMSRRRGGSYTPPPTPPPSEPVVTLKNVQLTPDSAASPYYDAFGMPFTTAADRVTYIFRSGTTHLLEGKHYGMHFTPSTGTWGNRFLVDEMPGFDLRDVAGGVMDNGEIIVFSCTQAKSSPEVVNAYAYFRKGNAATIELGDRVQLVGGSTGHAEYWVNFPWGKLTKGEAPGEYYIGFYQQVLGGQYRPCCLKTTDYFTTWTVNQITLSNSTFSETSVVYIGSGKLLAFVRINQGGYVYAFASSDSGVTWTARGHIRNLGWYTQFVKIPHAFMHNGLLYVMYHDRFSKFTAISKGNDPNVVFPDALHYSDPELYYYNDNGSISGNPSLGYPSVEPLGNGKFLVMMCKENGSSSADILYAVDDLVTDPAGMPDAIPYLAISNITSNGFRMDIKNYTVKQLENIRYFEFDIATDAAFTSFVTAKLFGTPAADLHIYQNYRMQGLWASFLELPTPTTDTIYHVRVRACNNAGKSVYSKKVVTSMAPAAEGTSYAWSDGTNSGHVFGVIGDSIATGTNESYTVTDPSLWLRGPNPNGALLEWDGGGIVPVTTKDTLTANKGTWHPQHAISYKANTGNNVVLVNGGYGGAEFYPTSDNYNWYTSGVLYNQFKNKINSALVIGGNPQIRGIYIILGINDARSASTLANIQIGMNSLIDRLNTDFFTPNIFLVNIGWPGSVMTAKANDVRKLLDNNDAALLLSDGVNYGLGLVQRYANITLIEDLYRYKALGYYAFDNLHLNQPGNNFLGNHLADNV